MEDQESLKSGTLVRELANTIQNKVNNLLSDGIMATSVVVGSIFLAGDKLFRMEKLPVGSSANLINYSGLQVDEDSAGNMFTRTYKIGLWGNVPQNFSYSSNTSFREKGVE